MPRLLSFLLVAGLASSAQDALAMRCGTNLVSEGQQDFQVRERCGEPFWTDRYDNLEIVGAYSALESQRSVQIDVWYYNFGPRQLMRQLLFRDGHLLREETLGYGVDRIGEDCNDNLDYRGLSTGELYARCGEPASRRIRNNTVVRRPAPGVERWRDERREEWIYDFGDDRFVRSLGMVNGRVERTDRLPR